MHDPIIHDPLGLFISLCLWSFVGYLCWALPERDKEPKEDYEPF